MGENGTPKDDEKAKARNPLVNLQLSVAPHFEVRLLAAAFPVDVG